VDVDRFTRERAAGWEELAGLVQEAGTRPQRLGAEPLLRLGRRYRAAAADLALARRLFPGDPLTHRLERLVTDARQCVYASEARRRLLAARARAPGAAADRAGADVGPDRAERGVGDG
jgi:hypothetical protein